MTALEIVESGHGTMGDKAASLLRVEGLEVSVPGEHGWVPATKGISFTVEAGEILGVVGESGSGKSLMAAAIAGLESFSGARVTGGSVTVAGRQVSRGKSARQRERLLGMVFQNPQSALNPSMKIGAQIAEIFRYHGNASREQAWESAVRLLREVGIAAAERRASDYPHHFSGGMLQRVCIAMALAGDPQLVLLDEPTTALDVTVQREILQLLRRLQEEHSVGMVFISHDLGVVAEIATRVAVMYAGELVEIAPRDEIFTSPKHPYTRALIQAMPVLSAERTDVEFLSGAVPGPGSGLVGCQFFDRCKHAINKVCNVSTIAETNLPNDAKVRCLRWNEI